MLLLPAHPPAGSSSWRKRCTTACNTQSATWCRITTGTRQPVPGGGHQLKRSEERHPQRSRPFRTALYQQLRRRPRLAKLVPFPRFSGKYPFLWKNQTTFAKNRLQSLCRRSRFGTPQSRFGTLQSRFGTLTIVIRNSQRNLQNRLQGYTYIKLHSLRADAPLDPHPLILSTLTLTLTPTLSHASRPLPVSH